MTIRVETPQANILNTTSGIILHGVNCQKTMGAGLAKALKDKWPEVYLTYLQTPPQLGAFTPVQLTNTLYVGNCYTQDRYGRGQRHLNYPALEQSLLQAFSFSKDNKLNVHMPLIGCGLAGGSPSIVAEIIGECAKTVDLYTKSTLTLYRTQEHITIELLAAFLRGPARDGSRN